MNFIYVYLGILFAIVLGAYYYYRSIDSNNKPLVDALYTEALNSMVGGDTNSAIGILKRVVKQDSNHVRAYQKYMYEYVSAMVPETNTIISMIWFGIATLRGRLTEK